MPGRRSSSGLFYVQTSEDPDFTSLVNEVKNDRDHETSVLYHRKADTGSEAAPLRLSGGHTATATAFFTAAFAAGTRFAREDRLLYLVCTTMSR